MYGQDWTVHLQLQAKYLACSRCLMYACLHKSTDTDLLAAGKGSGGWAVCIGSESESGRGTEGEAGLSSAAHNAPMAPRRPRRRCEECVGHGWCCGICPGHRFVSAPGHTQPVGAWVLWELFPGSWRSPLTQHPCTAQFRRWGHRSGLGALVHRPLLFPLCPCPSSAESSVGIVSPKKPPLILPWLGSAQMVSPCPPPARSQESTGIRALPYLLSILGLQGSA